jgi:hypothetical protein
MNQPSSPLSALVFSSDPQAVSTVAKILESHGFGVKMTSNPIAAEELCRCFRFDLGVFDLGAAGWSELLHLKSAPRVVIGLTGPGQLKNGISQGIHFLLQKPFTADLFTKTMKAAYGTIATDRLRSFRHQVSIPAKSCRVVHDAQSKSLERTRIVNLSQTGVCLQTEVMLPQGSGIQVSFALPESGLIIQMRGTVIWAHASGRAGIKITEFTCGNESLYDAWLTSMLPSTTEPLWKAGAAGPYRKPMTIPIIAPAAHSLPVAVH